jgi:hypothetical protein
MPKSMGYKTEDVGAEKGEGAGPLGNAADVRRAKAPKGSAAEHIENSMKAGERSLEVPGPNSIVKHKTWPTSPHADMQSRTRSKYKRIFEKGNA